MAKIKKGDFIELEFTGRLKGTNEVFDTTDEALAKETGIYGKNMKYGPVIVCVGEFFTLEGIEEQIIDKEPGSYKLNISPEKGFGKKNAKLIRMIPSSAFRAQQINPEPGLQIDVDGQMGIIKTAGGGRCLVDFNHPLSGKELAYDIKINRIVTDDAEKIKGFLELSMKLRSDVEVKEEKAVIKTEKKIPKALHDTIAEKLKELIPSVKTVEFAVKEAEKEKPAEKPEETEKTASNKK